MALHAHTPDSQLSQSSQAILKRILKVTHPILQLYVLKVIKSQVPYCGRKWRQCKCCSYSTLTLARADNVGVSKHEGHHSHLPQLQTGSARRMAYHDRC